MTSRKAVNSLQDRERRFQEIVSWIPGSQNNFQLPFVGISMKHGIYFKLCLNAANSFNLRRVMVTNRGNLFHANFVSLGLTEDCIEVTQNFENEEKLNLFRVVVYAIKKKNKFV